MLLKDDLLKDVIDINKYRKYLFDAYFTGYLEEFKTKIKKIYILSTNIRSNNKLNEFINEKIQISLESLKWNYLKMHLIFQILKELWIQRILN